MAALDSFLRRHYFCPVKKFFSYRLSVRLLSILLPIGALVADWAAGQGVSFSGATKAFAGAASMLLHYPDSNSDGVLSVVWVSVFSGLYLTGIVCFPEMAMVAAVASPLAYYSTACANRFRMPSRLFTSRMVWNSIEDYSRGIRLALFLGAVIVVSFFELPGVVEAVIMAVQYIILYYCAYSGRTLIMSSEKEDEIKRMVATRLWSPEADRGPEEVRSFYDRLRDYMKESKPFLDENLTLKSLAMRIGTNRSYLSRTINLCYGGNFNKFINSYRVEYAIELLKKDPRMKMWELAYMCGFHNQVTFTTAFRYFYNTTPAEYMREQVRVNNLFPSRMQERKP